MSYSNTLSRNIRSRGRGRVLKQATVVVAVVGVAVVIVATVTILKVVVESMDV